MQDEARIKGGSAESKHNLVWAHGGQEVRCRRRHLRVQADWEYACLGFYYNLTMQVSNAEISSDELV